MSQDKSTGSFVDVMAKILLAEDDDLTRTTLAKFLRVSGYDVALAEDGSQALSLLNEDHFDLVLSDVAMPAVNGFDLLDHVSAVSPGTPVVLMTAYPLFARITRNPDRAPEFVFKPLVLKDLIDKIEKLLDQQKS